MTGSLLSRRRALALIGVAAGVPLLGPGSAVERAPQFAWRGTALGADARLLLVHPVRDVARRVIARCLEEVARLERIFSLHDPASELSRLNRDGGLEQTSHELRILLAEAHRFGALTGGAFDVTVQPLWQLYAAHFAAHPDDTVGPSAHRIASALRRVDYRLIAIEGARVRLLRPAMALTLNGIAQGFITDRVADLLREAGFERVLVQLGETVAGAPPADGTPWRVGIADPLVPERTIATLAASDVAIAVSSGSAARFDAAGRHHHLFDPATGRSADGCAGITVLAARATTADALSTALAVLPRAVAPRLLRAAGASALYVAADGSREWLAG